MLLEELAILYSILALTYYFSLIEQVSNSSMWFLILYIFLITVWTLIDILTVTIPVVKADAAEAYLAL